jgi:hypothetical protein
MPRALSSLLALALAGCATERVRGIPVIPADEVCLVVEDGGPWREVAPGAEGPAAPAGPTSAPPTAAPAEPPRGDAVPVPRRRGPAAPPRGTRPAKSPEVAARERYLDHPTLLRASRITFRCPPAYIPECRLAGASVREEAPGRRLAEGRARLVCRELTLEADSLVLEARTDGRPDLQWTARGAISFVSDQRGQVFRHEGVRSLLVTNDRVVALP